jgi:two-component system cell cycle sensor histidine kinase/response regulator CckA
LKAVREIKPKLRVIFISGYAEEAFRNSPDRPEDFHFLPKPFSLKQLTSKVKEVLGEG